MALSIRHRIDEFQSIVNDICRSYESGHSDQRRSSEFRLQTYLVRNPIFLYRGRYTRLWAEPKIYVNDHSSKYVVPDFVLQTEFTGEAEVLDLKLPSARILKQKADEFTKDLIKAIEQVLRYQQVINIQDPQFYLGGEVEEVKSFCVFIGRSENRDNVVGDLISREFGENEIEIINYDRVIQIQEDLLEGLMLVGSNPKSEISEQSTSAAASKLRR